MPYPQNVEMAMGTGVASAAIWRHSGDHRHHGRAPEGRVSGDDSERLARAGGGAVKASRRDTAALLVTGEVAGTTVATTMQIAALAGIRVFATGGIGGVHRGAGNDVRHLGRPEER
jgi:pseudouridine-5'-phosphate glycosidase